MRHEHRQMQIIITVVKEWVSLPSSTTTYKFFKAVVRGSSFMSYKKTRGWTSISTGLCSQATCNLTKPFLPTHTDKHKHKHTPHLMTPSFQRNGTILNCMFWTGICKLSKLQMIACSLLATEGAIKSTISESCLYAKSKDGKTSQGFSWQQSCLSVWLCWTKVLGVVMHSSGFY